LNAQSIWAGNDYAFIPEKRRGERFSLRAHRVRVRRVLKETRTGNTKSSTFVEVNFVDRDTGEVIEYNGWRGIIDRLDGGTFKVRAYDFVDFWESIEDEYRHLVKKQEQENFEREERERQYREQREREAAERQAKLDHVKNYLIQRGVEPEWIDSIQLDGYGYYDKAGIKLSFRRVETSMLEERERGSRSLYDSAKGSEQGRD
jgi:hypothetical protein